MKIELIAFFFRIETSLFWVSCLNEAIQPLIDDMRHHGFKHLIFKIYSFTSILKGVESQCKVFLGNHNINGDEKLLLIWVQLYMTSSRQKVKSSFKAGINISFRILFVLSIKEMMSMCGMVGNQIASRLNYNSELYIEEGVYSSVIMCELPSVKALLFTIVVECMKQVVSNCHGILNDIPPFCCPFTRQFWWFFFSFINKISQWIPHACHGLSCPFV